MATATVTSKGQLTLPKNVRDQLGIKAGDRLDVTVQPDGSVRMFPTTLKVDDVFGMLAAYRPKKPVTLEQMDTSIKRAAGRAAGRSAGQSARQRTK